MPNFDRTAPPPSSAPGANDLSLPRFSGLYWLTAFIAALVLGDVLFWSFGLEAARSPLGWNLSFLAALIGGARFIYHAITELLEGKFGTDLALALALLAGLLLEEYWVAAEVVLIALIGESLEAITYGRTQRELRRLIELQPATARVRRGESIIDEPLSSVRKGDIVVIRPAERVPVDGKVIEGRSSVDQSTLTGESLPADKDVDDEVFAGTLNQYGSLEIRVTRVAGQSVLGQVLEAVADARSRKGNVERLVDRMTRFFLPLVLLFAAITFLAHNWGQLGLLAQGESVSAESLQWLPTLAVLVVACPCALVLATPAAMLASLAWLARRGVLVRGGGAIERLAAVTHFAFDKTGTLTDGRLAVTDCIPLSGADSTHVLRLAAAAEQPSEHLIARAIMRAASEQQIDVPPVAQFTGLPGAGVDAQLARTGFNVPAAKVLVGNRRLHDERKVEIPAEALEAIQRLDLQGRSSLLVSENGTLIGVLGLGDSLRPEALATINELRSLGINDLAVLSGDRQSSVSSVARALQIERFAGDLRPIEKANWLADWTSFRDERTGVSAGHSQPRRPAARIAMVGDGINDAPALATADVGIALRSIGSEVAAEAADVILLGEPLRHLPSVVKLARETVRVIYQNVILFAFAANFVGVVVTAWILPAWSDAWMRRSPVIAALFHQLGSLLVLLNAMRLIYFDRWQASRLFRWEMAISKICAAQSSRLRPAVSAMTTVWHSRAAVARLAFWALLLAYLSQTIAFVGPDEVAIVKRFGRIHDILGPGPHLRLPPPFDRLIREQPQRIRSLRIGISRNAKLPSDSAIEWSSSHTASDAEIAEGRLWLTGDRSLVELAATIQYRVADVKAFRFASREPERLLAAITESVIHESVASLALLTSAGEADQPGELLSHGRADLELQIGQRLQQRASSLGLGVEIVEHGVCLQDVHPPLPVVDAFRDVSSAFKERERMKNEADAYRRDALIQAAGETAWQELDEVHGELTQQHWSTIRTNLAGQALAEINTAQSFAEERQKIAAGDAAAFLLAQAAQAHAPELTHWRLFMDTLADSLPGKSKLVFDRAAGGRRQLFLGPMSGSPIPAVASPTDPPIDEED